MKRWTVLPENHHGGLDCRRAEHFLTIAAARRWHRHRERQRSLRNHVHYRWIIATRSTCT